MSAFNKSSIDWCDYTWNPLTGCKHGCPYCYARAFALRKMGRYKETRFEPTVHLDRLHVEPPKSSYRCVLGQLRIFVCSMGDFAGPWKWRVYPGRREAPMTPVEVQTRLWCYIERYPQHQFILLTKNPAGLKRGNLDRLPSNLVWGISITGDDTESVERLRVFNEVRRPGEKSVISLEPCFDRCPELPEVEPGMGWLIIGALTGGKGYVTPWAGWVNVACQDAYKKGWVVWVKDNMREIHPYEDWPREQLPLPVVEER